MQNIREMTEAEMVDYLENIVTYFQSTMSRTYGVTTAVTIYRHGEKHNTIHFHGDLERKKKCLGELKIAFVDDYEQLIITPSSSTSDLLKALSVVGDRRYVEAVKSFSVCALLDRGEDISSYGYEQRRIDEMKLLTSVNKYLNKAICDEEFLGFKESFFLLTTASVFGKHYAPLLMVNRRLDESRMDILVELLREQVQKRMK